jgi:hypothetical protein
MQNGSSVTVHQELVCLWRECIVKEGGFFCVMGSKLGLATLAINQVVEDCKRVKHGSILRIE